MKQRTLFAAAVLLATGPLSLSAQSLAGPAEPAADPQPPVEMLVEAYGWFLAQQMEVYAFGLNEAELAAFTRGVASAARGEEIGVDLERIGPAMQQFLGSRPAEVAQRRLAEGRAEEEAFFAKLDADPKIQKTEAGLRYEILAPGSGPRPTLGSTVVAHYTGTFVNGKVFDSSVKRGEPAEFPLNGVIEGWQIGIPLIAPGGRIKLYIPGRLAYGDTGRMNIPPAKALVFDVELLGARNETPQPLPPAPPLVPAP